MTSKYHSATFTESKILEHLGAGEETITKIRGRCSNTTNIEKIPTTCRFIPDLQERIGQEGHIIYDKPIKLQVVFDEVHQIFPSFSIQELVITRQVEEYSDYYLKKVIVTRALHYKTFGFKPGTFQRFGAIISPGEVVYHKFKKMKKGLKEDVPKQIYRRIKDCVLMNDTTYTRKDLETLFLDPISARYMLVLEEKKGIFHLRDFMEYETNI